MYIENHHINMTPGGIIMRKTVFLLLLSVLCIGAQLSAVTETKTDSASVEKTMEQKRTDWLDSRIPAGINPADLSPDQLKRFLFEKERVVNHWISVQGDVLLRALVIAFAFSIGFFVAGYICSRLIRRALKKAHRNVVLWELLHAFNAPFFLAVGVIGIFFAFYPVLVSFEKTVFLYDVRFFFTVLSMIAAWAALNMVGVINTHLQRLAQRDDNNLDDLMVKVLRDIMRIIVFATTILFIGQSIFKINITALLAGAGVLGLGAALAAKDTLSNFFGTIVILFDRPFKLGDRIQVGSLEGVVCEVGMRSSKIIADDESVYTLPNSLLTTEPVRNINLKNHLKLMFDLTMTYDTTPEQMERAIQLLHEITDNFHGTDSPGYSPRIFFSKFADSSMNITVIMWLKTESYAQEEAWRTELNMAILKQFSAENLNFAYPTNTTYLVTNKNEPVEVRVSPPSA